MSETLMLRKTRPFLFAAIATAIAVPAVAVKPTTLPAFTHTLTLVTTEGYHKGPAPSHYCLVLPDDWRSTGTSGTWRVDSDDDAEQATRLHDLTIKHGAGDTVHIDLLPGVLDVVWYIDLHITANSSAPFGGTWNSAAAFGVSGKSTSSSGTATIAMPRHPTTKP